MGDVSVEFNKPIFKEGKLNDVRKNTLRLREEGFKTLPLGGAEGRKFFTPLVNPRYREGRKDVAPELGFISKEDERKDFIEIIRIYDLLRKKGYPVPATTRYFEKDGHTYLMMTDMTEGGKYKIWGYSEPIQQKEELVSMNLNEEDIKKIRKIVLGFANKANKDDIFLPFYTYNVRKNLETGEINIVFLDANTEIEPSKYVDARKLDSTRNNKEALNFILQLKNTMER